MDVTRLADMASTLHTLGLKTLTRYQRAPEPGSGFGCWTHGPDRFDTMMGFDILGGTLTTPSAHDTIDGRCAEGEGEALFAQFCQELATLAPLLATPTHVCLNLGLSDKGSPTFLLQLEGLSPQSGTQPVLIHRFTTRLEEMITAMNGVYAVMEPGPFQLYTAIGLNAVLAAPSPEASILKLHALLRPKSVLVDKNPGLVIPQVALLCDEYRTENRFADLKRALFKETP